MIARQDMMVPLLDALPSFRSEWEAFLVEWQNEREVPLYLALGQLAKHLISMLASRDTSKFPDIFMVVERWHLEGDEYVREAATVGLLENLQNKNLHEITTPAQFEAFLSSESRKWWTKVDRFWSHGEIITES